MAAHVVGHDVQHRAAAVRVQRIADAKVDFACVVEGAPGRQHFADVRAVMWLVSAVCSALVRAFTRPSTPAQDWARADVPPAISASVALMAGGTATFSAFCRACLLASNDRGPISRADRPPARWVEATRDNGWPTTFRSSAFRPGAISAAGRLTN